MLIFYKAVLVFFIVIALATMFNKRERLKDRLFYLLVFIVLVILVILLQEGIGIL